MPRRSIAVLSQSEIRNLKINFSNFLSHLSPAQLQEFFEEFLTEEEQIMLSKRLMLYKMLYSSQDLVHIQQALGISRETTRLYNQIKNTKSKRFKNEISKLNNSKRDTKNEGNALSDFLDTAIDSRSSAKARAKLYQGDFEK